MWNNRSCARIAAILAALLLGPVGGFAADGPVQSCDTSTYPLSSPTSRFEDHGDGTVTDRQAKLMWMHCSLGQSWENGRCTGLAARMNWLAAQAAAKALNKDGKYFFGDWRLPLLPELATIAERQCKNPRINLQVFPDTPSDAYWSATSREPVPTEPSAFTLSFGPDGVKYANKEEPHDVRLVRTAP